MKNTTCRLPVVERTFLFHVQFELPSLNREKYYMYPWISNFRRTNNSPTPAPGGKNGKKETIITSLTEKSYDIIVMCTKRSKDWVGQVPMRKPKLLWASEIDRFQLKPSHLTASLIH